ncbi:MAG: hypothetical protein ABJB76_08015 [Candidatus Nitrosocosmicus sp.]
MSISTKKLSIIILLTLITVTILTSFYIYKTFSMGYITNQQLEPYGKNILVSDKNALNNFTATLYPLYKSLDDIMTNVITNKSNNDLFNMSLPLINQAKKIDSGNKGIDDPYGLPKGIEESKRLILDQIMEQFKLKNPGKELVYSFIATEDCNMYVMEDYPSEKQLKQGVYPDHPWCVEFYYKKDRSAEYLTEFYYAKSKFTKVSSIVFPLHSNNGNISFYVGGTLDLYKFTKDFINRNNLGEWPKTQLLLLVTYHDDGTKALFDPQTTASRGIMHYKNIDVPKYENSSFTEDDQRELIKSIGLFDNGDGAGKTVSTNNGTYLITATSQNLPNPYDIANPLQNHSHMVEWEWVLIRNIPDTQATISELISVLDYYQSLNLLIVPLFIIALIGIGITVILYKKLRKSGRGW